MSWIKIRTNLATDPAVAAIGIRTNMHPRQVVGCLVAVWCWADPLTADGFIPHATERLIDDISGKRGFAAAMTGVQWLCVEAGGVRFPNWDRHHSQSAKARAGESERKRLARSGEMSAPPVRKMSGQSSGQTTEQCPDQRRGDKRREENTDKPANPPASADEAKAPRPRNEILDTLATVGGGSPEQIPPSRWSAVQRCLREIKAVTPDLTPNEIRRRSANYRTHFRDAVLTPEALMKHWPMCENAGSAEHFGKREKTAGWNTP